MISKVGAKSRSKVSKLISVLEVPVLSYTLRIISRVSWILIKTTYGSGHEGVAVLLLGFAIN